MKPIRSAACWSALLALCLPAQEPAIERLPDAEWTLEAARHLLFRAGFGGTPAEIAALHGLGLEAAVQHLVEYEAEPDVVGALDLAPSPPPDRKALAQMSEEERRRAANQARSDDRRQVDAVVAWWYERMLRGRRPLEEKLTLFWHGHFTSSYQEVQDAAHMLQQNRLLREHASGSFRALVHAISRDPAMLRYLDGNRNVRGRPNENYARELMELFTLGVGNYTESDVKEAARAFTGFCIRDGSFVQSRARHDGGTKTFLGRTGHFDGDAVVDIVLDQPAAPRFVAAVILGFFVSEDAVAGEQVEPFARLLRAHDWQLKPMLRALFSSRWFYDPRHRATQVKSPVMLVVSTARMLELSVPPPRLAAASAGLGQRLLFPPNVKGWAQGRSWISTSSLLERCNVAEALLRGGPVAGRRRPGASDRPKERADRADAGFSALAMARAASARSAAEIVDLFLARLLAVPLPAPRRQVLVDFLAPGGTPFDTAARGAEARLRALLHLIMSLPEFQLC